MWTRRAFLSLPLLPSFVFAAGPGQGLIIILLGSPGAGKTTQAERLKREYRIPFLSASEAIKKSHGKKSKISKALSAEAASGELLSDAGLNDLMIQSIKKSDFTRGFILDGYPATKGQADFLAAQAIEMKLDPPLVLFLDVPDDVARQRMAGRGRADDKPETIERRLSDYRRELEAIRAAYPADRFVRIDGSKSEAEVAAAVKAALQQR